MKLSDLDLLVQVKKSYEMGRIKRSLWILLVTLAMTTLSYYSCGDFWVVSLLGFLLSLVAVGYLWRGQVLRKAGLFGLKLGILALGVPLAFHFFEICCHSNIEAELCFGVGGLVGTLLGFQISHFENHRAMFAISAGGLALIAGLMGCISMGSGATVGMTLGIFIPIYPVYFFRRRHLTLT